MEMVGGSTRAVPIYELLADEFRNLGVESVFGLLSDDTAALVAALDSRDVRFFGARHENNAIVMAESYAHASGRLGVALIGRGPATANGLHGASYAARTGSPVLLVFGEAPTGAPNGLGPDYKQFNAIAVLNGAGLRTFVAGSATTACSTLQDAVDAVRRGLPAALLLPADVQQAQGFAATTTRPQPPAPASVKPQPEGLAAAAKLLAEAKRPLIIAGRGAHLAGARAAIEELAERVGAMLVTSLKAKDLFRGNPWNLGVIGSFSHSAGRRMIDQADCVLVLGAGLNFLTSSFGHSIPHVPLIHVDAARAHIGRWHRADIALTGDAKLTAEALSGLLPARDAAGKPFHSEENRRALAAFDIAADFQEASTARTVDARALAVRLDKLLPAERNIIYDAGNFMGVIPYLSVPGPANFKLTSDFMSIGLGFGAALGFAAARSDVTNVLIIGDGGLLMTLGELETAIREDLPLVVIAMNDCAYGAELHHLRLRDLPVGKAVFPDVDFAPIAEALGFRSATIRSLSDLEAMADALRRPDGPIFLDCKINAAIASPFLSEVANAEKH